MIKVLFEKNLCSHGIILNAYNTNKDCVATYYPLYDEIHVYDKNFSWLEEIMRSVHFDHQFEEIERWKTYRKFLLDKCRKEEELKARLRYEKFQRNFRSA